MASCIHRFPDRIDVLISFLNAGTYDLRAASAALAATPVMFASCCIIARLIAGPLPISESRNCSIMSFSILMSSAASCRDRLSDKGMGNRRRTTGETKGEGQDAYGEAVIANYDMGCLSNFGLRHQVSQTGIAEMAQNEHAIGRISRSGEIYALLRRPLSSVSWRTPFLRNAISSAIP
jgi:hypothetical protein